MATIIKIMETLFTKENIMFGVWGLTMIFGVYLYFRKPQEDLDKKQALDAQAADGETAILAAKVEWERQASEKRFADFQNSLATSTALAQNHIHTIDVKVDSVALNLTLMDKRITSELVRLSTIIEERIPKKEV